jgi:hypothetical protein
MKRKFSHYIFGKSVLRTYPTRKIVWTDLNTIPSCHDQATSNHVLNFNIKITGEIRFILWLRKSQKNALT